MVANKRNMVDNEKNLDYPQKQELGLDVLDYEFENFRKFTSPLVEFIKGINYQNKYTAIFETLSLLQDEIFKNIDDVTIL